MKKLIFGAAALLFTGAMYAQPNPEPAIPNPNAPVAPQTAPNFSLDPDANTGYSIQTGNANKVEVLQIGTRQSVWTDQGNGLLGAGGNLAQISQTGDVQAGSGVENAAEVYQRGGGNQSATIQQGDGNEALTEQGRVGLGLLNVGNKSRIQQGNNGQAQDNKAHVYQLGLENQANILQTYDNNEARADQAGIENKSNIRQIANPNQSDGHRAGSVQVGFNNQSWIDQNGNGARNVADVLQDGANNYADQKQFNTELAGSPNYDDMNEAAISQIVGNYDGSLGAILNGLDNLQAGPLDGAGVGLSINAIAFQAQNGRRNDVEAYQGGGLLGASNYSEQNQTGNGNDAIVFQNVTLDPTSLGGNNYARQDQTGNRNTAGVVQGGVNHKAYQRQFGNRNEALSSQIGDNNCVNTYQEGNLNWVTTTQSGNMNQMLVVQKDGQSYTGIQHGTGNSTNILQLDPGSNPASIDCVFPDQLTPQTPLEIPDLTLTAPCPDC